jgi:hypothetical protein
MEGEFQIKACHKVIQALYEKAANPECQFCDRATIPQFCREMKHKFIINDDTIVNEYGYRVMTDGIDTKQFMRNPVVLYMHSRSKSTGHEGDEVIGRVVGLEKESGQLIGEVEFDVADAYAKKIAGKVDRGYIRMASLYADVKETSTDPEYLLPGQAYETVTQSKLIEVSIVDIGGNDNAIKLSRDGKPIKLQKISNSETKKDMDIKTIALSLGLDSNTGEEAVLEKVREMKLAKEKAEARVEELENDISKSQRTEAESLTDKAVSLGLIPEALKGSQLKSFESDFDGQKAVLSKLISEKESTDEKDKKHIAVKEVVLGKGKGKTPVEQTYDYLQKNDPTELRRIHDEEPEEYVRLAKEYGAGKRHAAE